jgi:predicted transcriptional regulator
MTQTIDNIVNKIRKFRKDMGYAKFKLATLADVPEGCVREIDKSTWNPTVSTLRKIERVVPDDFQPKSNPKKLPIQKKKQ